MRADTRMLACALLVATLWAPSVALAGPAVAIAVPELVAAEPEFDGAAVSVQAEAIGEALRADPGHVWVNLLDHGIAVGVVMTEAQAATIGSFGDWARNGDSVRVTGVFNQACDQHGGDLDVHATEVVIVAPGTPREHPVSMWKAIVALAAILLVLVLYAAYRRASRREDFSVRCAPRARTTAVS